MREMPFAIYHKGIEANPVSGEEGGECMNYKERHEKLMQRAIVMQRAIAMCIKIDKLEAENAELKEQLCYYESNRNTLYDKIIEHNNQLKYEIASWKARWDALDDWICTEIKGRNMREMKGCDSVSVTELELKMHDLESGDSEDISLCKSCGCMTHTAENNICGKCGKIKPDGSESALGATWGSAGIAQSG